jgi:2-dehydropantoate 2-reductase
MRILMFGRGVISTVYGWALARAGHEVEFYVRPGRAAEYGDTLRLELIDARRRPWGELRAESWSPTYREEIGAADGFDLVIVSLPHHRLAEAAAFLGPRVGDATVLVFGNVWDEPLDAIGPLPPDQVVWGFPTAGGGFGADGVLRASLLPTAAVGRLAGAATARELQVGDALRSAGLRIREEPDMRGRLLIHVVMDAGILSEGLRAGALADLLGSRAAFRDALRTSRELLPLLEARGVDLARHRGETLPLRAPTGATATAMAWAMTRIPAARASIAAHTDPAAEEPRALCRDVLAQARRLGIPAPRLEAAELLFAAPASPATAS